MTFDESAAKDRELRGVPVPELHTPDGLEKYVEESVAAVTLPAVCIPVLTPTRGPITMWWHLSQISILFPMNIGRQPIIAHDSVGGEIGEMRNRCIAMALAIEDSSNGKTKIPGVLWVDDDVIVDPWCLARLVKHGVPIASGVYFCKGEYGDPLIFPGASAGTMPFKPDEQFEAWGWSQGLCYVWTEVYRRMRDELDLGKDKYGQPKWYGPPDFEIKKEGIVNGGTEDFRFFANAHKLGYKPLIDCHRHAFGFHFDLRKNLAYPVKQWEQFTRKEPIVWPATAHHGEVVWG